MQTVNRAYGSKKVCLSSTQTKRGLQNLPMNWRLQRHRSIWMKGQFFKAELWVRRYPVHPFYWNEYFWAFSHWIIFNMNRAWRKGNNLISRIYCTRNYKTYSSRNLLQLQLQNDVQITYICSRWYSDISVIIFKLTIFSSSFVHLIIACGQLKCISINLRLRVSCIWHIIPIYPRVRALSRHSYFSFQLSLLAAFPQNTNTYTHTHTSGPPNRHNIVLFI